MKFATTIASLLVMILSNQTTWAQAGAPTRSVRDPALRLEIDVVQGPAVNVGQRGGDKVHVVEFWATWCPPCRQSAPHLSALQKKYADDGLVVLGISDEDAKTVRDFLGGEDADMDYTVAVDRGQRTMSRYFEAYQLNGIPHAFVVDKGGNIVWHGHPMDPALEESVVIALKQTVRRTQTIRPVASSSRTSYKSRSSSTPSAPRSRAGSGTK